MSFFCEVPDEPLHCIRKPLEQDAIEFPKISDINERISYDSFSILGSARPNDGNSSSEISSVFTRIIQVEVIGGSKTADSFFIEFINSIANGDHSNALDTLLKLDGPKKGTDP